MTLNEENLNKFCPKVVAKARDYIPNGAELIDMEWASDGHKIGARRIEPRVKAFYLLNNNAFCFNMSANIAHEY